MDITFKTEEGRFNYRVCAVIINKNKLLAMKDVNTKYFYLPGGRVMFHETAEEAILREVKEELEVDGEIIRPLWINQGFFTEDFSNEKYHELCIYFLVDVSKTKILSLGDKFTLVEGEKIHSFQWLPFIELTNEYLYPLFIKKRIFNLPISLELITEKE